MTFVKGQKREKVERKKITHTVRTEKNGRIEIPHYTRKIAIKLFCTECMGFGSNPLSCGCPVCPLFPFRRNSNLAREVKIDDIETDKEDAADLKEEE